MFHDHICNGTPVLSIRIWNNGVSFVVKRTVGVNATIRICYQDFNLSGLFTTQISMFISEEKCRSRGVIISWLASKGIFCSFDVLKGVNSEKFSDFLELLRTSTVYTLSRLRTSVRRGYG